MNFAKFSLVIALLLSLLCYGVLPAQNYQIIGRVTDQDGKPLPGVNVYLKGTIFGSATNDAGWFRIDRVPAGEFVLVFSVIGYQEKELPVSVGKHTSLTVGEIRLNATPYQAGPVVVTASKYEQAAQEVPVSIAVVSEKDIRFRNIISIDEALQYIPGVNLNSTQINIRGSSGYSRGIGSRTLLLIDGLPFLTGDTREVNFDVIPTYLIQRIEVIKGASSALYGSSALGGVVNVITPPIYEQPRIYARAYGGWYSEPYYPQWRWSKDNRYINGQSVYYSQKKGKMGWAAGFKRDEDDSYRRNGWVRRWNITGRWQWDFSPYRKLELLGNFMDQRRGNFLFWKSLRNALEPPEDQLDDRVHSRRFFIGGKYRWILRKDKFINLRGIWFRNHFEDNVSEGGGNISDSDNLDFEIQYNSTLGGHFLTLGAEGYRNSATSNIFGNHYNSGGAVYFQDEWAPFSRWRVNAGGRLDYYNIPIIGQDIRFNPKLGVVFRPRVGTAFRFSAGSGFRAPSLAEYFTSTTAAGLKVIPNFNLKPESSFSAEGGWNQLWSTFLISDVTIFYNYFQNLIEPSFTPKAKVQFQNVTRARIWGTEVSLNARLKHPQLTGGIGYTYMDPRDLTRNDFLQFRPRHLLYSYLKWEFLFAELGIDYRYIARYDRVDETLGLIIPDVEARVAAHIVDLRLAADFPNADIPLKFSIQVKNLFQYNYTDLVGSVAPIRQFMISLELNSF